MITDDAKHEAVADSSLKEEGVKLGDTIKDTASGKSFTIVGFTKISRLVTRLLFISILQSGRQLKAQVLLMQSY